MNIKIKIAFTFAILACGLTTFSALAGQARVETVLYRGSVSVILFGLLGYFVTKVVQHQLERKFAVLEQKGQKVDLSQPPVAETSDDEQNTQFSPLISNNLEHISSVKQ